LTAHHAPALEEVENEEEVEDNEIMEEQDNAEQYNDTEENAMNDNTHSRKREAESYVRNHFRGSKVAKLSQAMIPVPAFQRTTIPCVPNCQPLFVGTIPMMSMWDIQINTQQTTNLKNKSRKPRTCKIWCGGSKCIGAKTFLKKKEFRHCEMLVYLIMSEMNERNSICSQIIKSYSGNTFKIQVFLLALYHSCSSNWRTEKNIRVSNAFHYGES
jgi:hypothetical protein